MDPREFYQLALRLVDGASPAEVRTAISRAYYATFHVGAEILRGMGFRISQSAKGHDDVQKRLSNSGDPEVMRVGSQLVDLRHRRNEADYDLNREATENPKTARGIVEQANRMIQTLDLCRQGSKCTQVIQAIRDWERMTGNLSNPYD